MKINNNGPPTWGTRIDTLTMRALKTRISIMCNLLSVVMDEKNRVPPALFTPRCRKR